MPVLVLQGRRGALPRVRPVLEKSDIMNQWKQFRLSYRRQTGPVKTGTFSSRRALKQEIKILARDPKVQLLELEVRTATRESTGVRHGEWQPEALAPVLEQIMEDLEKR